MGFLCTALLAYAGLVSAAAKYDQYILAPSSRTIYPVSVYQGKVNGTVTGAESIAGEATGSAIFTDVSAVTYDFGKNIGGLVSLQIGNVDPDQFIGLTYSESSLWISGVGSDATADSGIDEIIGFNPTGPGTYTVEPYHERGGFRYLSLIHNTTGNIEVQQISVYFTPMPHVADDALQNYTGYFHSDDELLNRIWYAGAYTNQLCTIDPDHGNSLIYIYKINSSMPGDSIAPLPWYINGSILNVPGKAVISDGAKRDRLIWPGDIAISASSIFVSTNDMETIAVSIDEMFYLQNTTTGQLPYAGTFPFSAVYSPTYHLYSLIDAAYYHTYTGDLAYLQGKWDAWKLAMNFSLGFVDEESGLFNATNRADWLRSGMGGFNIEANAILYYTLNQGLSLAAALNDTSVIEQYTSVAAGIKTAANAQLWNATAGLFRDNETVVDFYPQDGNSWAIVSNLTDSPEKNTAISSALTARWTPYGPPAVEAQDAVSPFISGFELHAHILANNVTAALDLLRLEWGFMLDDPRMTNSTFIEGYSADGELHYAPYTNDPRVSHAHGWATGPTSVLSFYIAGIQLLGGAGRTWLVAPRPGGLTSVDAGYETPLGVFSAATNASAEVGVTGVDFSAPVGTVGGVSLPYPSCAGTVTLVEVNGAREDVVVDVLPKEGAGGGTVEIDGLQGGDWQLRFSCST